MIHRIAKTALVLALTGAAMAPAQDLHPSRRPSPMGMARATVGDAYVRVVYSRPYLRGRDNIFGTEESEALVPFGKIWRTGANEATELSVTRDVMIGDQKVPAGTYSLFTTPGPESWTLHVNSELGMNGTMRRNAETGEYESAYSEANDLATATGTVEMLEEPVDQLTIGFETTEAGFDMVLSWTKTRVRFPMKIAG